MKKDMRGMTCRAVCHAEDMILIGRLESQERVCTGLPRIKSDYLRESAAWHSLPLFWLSLCSPVVFTLAGRR
jgi:hypothetical protein